MMLPCPDCGEEVCPMPPNGDDRGPVYEAFTTHAVEKHDVRPGADARWWAGQRGFRAWLDADRVLRPGV